MTERYAFEKRIIAAWARGDTVNSDDLMRALWVFHVAIADLIATPNEPETPNA